MPAPDVPTLTAPQYLLLRSLKQRGIEAGFREIFLRRCGATEDDWSLLTTAGYVELQELDKSARFVLTTAGKRVYNRRPGNVWF